MRKIKLNVYAVKGRGEKKRTDKVRHSTRDERSTNVALPVKSDSCSNCKRKGGEGDLLSGNCASRFS